MLCVRIIPCLDCRGGRVVKGIRFQNLRDAGDPAELGAEYEAEGADELTLLDVSATVEGRSTAVRTVREVRRSISIPLTVGGGVRSADDASALLDAGADKVSINSGAVEDPGMITRIARRFGAQCCVIAIDGARRAEGEGCEVVVRSGTTRTGIDVVEWAKLAASLGAGEVLLTSFDRDGTRQGYDLELIREVSAAVSTPVVASGGASKPEDVVAAVKHGADAVLAASIFHDREHRVRDLKSALRAAGCAVRLEEEGNT